MAVGHERGDGRQGAQAGQQRCIIALSTMRWLKKERGKRCADC